MGIAELPSKQRQKVNGVWLIFCPKSFRVGFPAEWRPATRIQLPRNALDLLDRSFDLNESFGQSRTQTDQFRHRLS
jgi:hypothetical protein